MPPPLGVFKAYLFDAAVCPPLCVPSRPVRLYNPPVRLYRPPVRLCSPPPVRLHSPPLTVLKHMRTDIAIIIILVYT